MTKLEQAARQVLQHWASSEDLAGAIIALREALSEPELNLNCKSVQKRLATSWGYVKAEQQEPVAWMNTNGAVNNRLKNAAQVRTKDLTDVEDLKDAMTKALKKAFQLGQTYFQQADSESYAANKRADITLEFYRKLEDDTRAVIAKFKEKNK